MSRARELAYIFLQRGDAKGWFDALYAEADNDADCIPWADLIPNPHLVSWMIENNVQGEGRRALVIGCGLGDDAESIAARGFDVTAFDISGAAIEWCKRRYPNSKVRYVVADLFELPEEWRDLFDFVLEINTLQVLPSETLPAATASITNCVTWNGVLLVIVRGRESENDPGNMPWPLTRGDLELFSQSGLKLIAFEDFFDHEKPPVRRFRAQYHKII